MNNKNNLKRESEGKKTRDSENVVLHVNIKKNSLKKKETILYVSMLDKFYPEIFKIYMALLWLWFKKKLLLNVSLWGQPYQMCFLINAINSIKKSIEMDVSF